MRAMQPVAHKFLSSAALALRDLRFVVRKNVVDAAAVNVHLTSQTRRRHCAALDVPAGATMAPGTFPRDIAVVFVPRFPESEVADMFLVVFVVLYSAGRAQLREIEMRELPVI